MIDVLDKERQGLDPGLREIIDQQAQDDGDFLLCANCAHVITRRAAAIEVNGSFEHQLTNPYGLEFHLGCFSAALGCAIAGRREAADTWFDGFRWRLASCEDCGIHLGWYFDQTDAQSERYFYGLILDHLCAPPDASED